MSFAVMISHSTKEKPIAEAVCQHLEAAGFSCWIAPRNIPPGAEWTTAIMEGIASSRMMVLVFSGSANESKHVAREVLYAGESRIPVLPFRVQDIAPSGGIAYYLLGLQWLDAWQGPLGPHLDALVARVRLMLAGGGGPDPAQETGELAEGEIHYACTHCGLHMAIATSAEGMRVDCLDCGQPVTIRAVGSRDKTPAPPPALPPAPPLLTPAVTAAITDRLVLILGPIARHLVKSAGARVSTLAELCRELAESIPDQKDRAAFLKSCRPELEAASASAAVPPSRPVVAPAAKPESPSTAWKPETLAAMKNGLAIYLGPLAHRLVDQAAYRARTTEELHDLLAAHIPSPKDREKWSQAFVRAH